MRLTRIIPRRLFRLCSYVAFGAFIVLIVPAALNVGNYRSRRSVLPNEEEESAGEPQKPPEGRPIEGHLAVDGGWKYGGKNAKRKDWTDTKLLENEAKRTGPGEHGAAFHLPTDADTKEKEDQIYRVNGYDGLASDFIALNRSIKDIRHPGCKKLKYLEELPKVSVILAAHNEHFSVLMRSCVSIVLRTPPELLKEIIIVDDASTKQELKEKLESYVRENLPKVRIVRTKKREGLIRARQVGAQAATGEVMVFLDAHSEPTINWLPPLIDPIAMDYRTVVCPFVDVIDCDTFEYKAQDDGGRGAFDWEFNYKRLPITEKDKANLPLPFDSPVMAGGYFAISSKFYWELGGYDDQLDIWGGEQYELSFKIWQCHGRMVDAPCSRVGHIYRCKHVPFPNPGVGDFISRNYKRVAEVWMDEYKEFLYERRGGVRNADPGDMSKQLAVRERLKCKSFKWFMTNVAFDLEKFYPIKEPVDGAWGKIKSLAAPAGEQLCLDTAHKDKGESFKLAPCGGGEQEFKLTWYGDIRPQSRSVCLDASTSVKRAPVVVFPCHGMQGNQYWIYDYKAKSLFHKISAQCLDCDLATKEIFTNPCDAKQKTQQWQFAHVNETIIDEWKAHPRTV